MGQCLFPIDSYWYGEYTENGKKKLLFHSDGKRGLIEHSQIACGRCIECRLNHARNWAIRCMYESSLYKDNFFVTLTYDDDHLFDSAGNVGAENLQYLPTVRADDISDFMKRLRSRYDYDFGHTGIRFFGCTEYGDCSHRPHIHLILFNLPIPDLKVYKKTDTGFLLYNSDYLSSIWTSGHVVIGEVSFDTCAYVAKYVVKKSSANSSSSDDFNLEPESIRMSRRPGIGTGYFKQNKNKFLMTDECFVDGHSYPIPPAWLRSIENDDPSIVASIKDNRKTTALSKEENKFYYSDLDPIDRWKNSLHKHKPIKRSSI